MNNAEFDVIKKYFTFASLRDDVLLAGGDDCAMVSVPANQQLLITTDTLISGVHFPEKTSAEDIAYKSLMVNLSDLAAMGATPAWVTLAISLPEINQPWLSAFSHQFSSVLAEFNIALIGGDTTRGPLSITVQAMGFAARANILRRDQARAGDKIFVTGELGDAAIGLQAIFNAYDDVKLTPCVNRLNRPVARVKFAEELSPYSNCAIDISDGLMADLGHVLTASQLGAQINLTDVPVSSAADYYFKHYHDNVFDWSMVLTKGDDYELCFTAHDDNHDAIIALGRKHQLRVSCIGEITDSKGIICLDENNQTMNFSAVGFNHF